MNDFDCYIATLTFFDIHISTTYIFIFFISKFTHCFIDLVYFLLFLHKRIGNVDLTICENGYILGIESIRNWM